MTDTSATGGNGEAPQPDAVPTDDTTTPFDSDADPSEEKREARKGTDVPRTPSHGEAPPENGEPLQPGEERREANEPPPAP